MKQPIKVITLCSGYDSQCMALDELKRRHPDFDYELVAWSEIDKYAIQMHNLVYPQWEDRNIGDMTKVDWQPIKDKYGEIDLLTYSTPCQSISQAGLQNGFEKGSGTRSSILWSTEEAIRVLRPRYLLQENVKAIISGYPNTRKKGKDGEEIDTFWSCLCKWMKLVENYGYTNTWKILNARDFNVPQNRERFFLLSQRNDIADTYSWPKPVPLERKLEDILENEVDERYFLKDESVGKFLQANDDSPSFFMQFDVPPTHEAAMFLKTIITEYMDNLDGWNHSVPDAKKIVECNYEKVMKSWKDWCYDNSALGEDFNRRYMENMKKNT